MVSDGGGSAPTKPSKNEPLAGGNFSLVTFGIDAAAYNPYGKLQSKIPGLTCYLGGLATVALIDRPEVQMEMKQQEFSTTAAAPYLFTFELDPLGPSPKYKRLHYAIACNGYNGVVEYEEDLLADNNTDKKNTRVFTGVLTPTTDAPPKRPSATACPCSLGEGFEPGANKKCSDYAGAGTVGSPYSKMCQQANLDATKVTCPCSVGKVGFHPSVGRTCAEYKPGTPSSEYAKMCRWVNGIK